MELIWMLLLILSGGFALYLIWIHTVPVAEEDADALIVLGYRCTGGRLHPLLEERLQSALQLIERHAFQKVILSGGVTSSSLSEAEIMKRYLLNAGISEERIITENESTDTVLNLLYCRDIMQRHKFERCIIISNTFHGRRVAWIARKLEVAAKIHVARGLANVFKQWRPALNECRAFYYTYFALKKALNKPKPE